MLLNKTSLSLILSLGLFIHAHSATSEDYQASSVGARPIPEGQRTITQEEFDQLKKQVDGKTSENLKTNAIITFLKTASSSQDRIDIGKALKAKTDLKDILETVLRIKVGNHNIIVERLEDPNGVRNIAGDRMCEGLPSNNDKQPSALSALQAATAQSTRHVAPPAPPPPPPAGYFSIFSSPAANPVVPQGLAEQLAANNARQGLFAAILATPSLKKVVKVQGGSTDAQQDGSSAKPKTPNSQAPKPSMSLVDELKKKQESGTPKNPVVHEQKSGTPPEESPEKQMIASALNNLRRTPSKYSGASASPTSPEVDAAVPFSPKEKGPAVAPKPGSSASSTATTPIKRDDDLAAEDQERRRLQSIVASHRRKEEAAKKAAEEARKAAEEAEKKLAEAISPKKPENNK